MWCHLVFLLPVLGLVLFWIFPWPLASAFYLALLGVSLVFYVASYRALRLRVTTGAEGMIGARGRVVGDIRSRGTVRVFNELWTAEANETIPADTPVRVIGVKGLVLRVAVDFVAGEERLGSGRTTASSRVLTGGESGDG